MNGESAEFLIGRQEEKAKIRACLQAKRNVLLEGPVGVGKTTLALAVIREKGLPVFRIDGDSRYSEQKLSGWFDPPSAIKKGFTAETFVPGPLVEAMRVGGVLFINELNRLPEGVQNVLLPAIDERMIIVPRLGEIQALNSFLVIATQNPKEFVATSHLSEAILDRFELVVLGYQSQEEEVKIVMERLQVNSFAGDSDLAMLPWAAVQLCRLTRDHPQVRRGASIRAALSIAEIAAVMLAKGEEATCVSFEEAFLSAALLALPTRIEIEREADSSASSQSEVETLIRVWVTEILTRKSDGNLKKKP